MNNTKPLNINTITEQEVSELKAGDMLDHLVHQAIDDNTQGHWIVVLDYSTDPEDFYWLTKMLIEKCEFYSFHMTADGYNVEYDSGRGIVQGDDIMEALCKAVVLNRIANR